MRPACKTRGVRPEGRRQPVGHQWRFVVDCILRSRRHHIESAIEPWNHASRLESQLKLGSEPVTQSPTQSIDPVNCFVALGVIPGSVESSGLGSVKSSGKTIRQRGSRLESKLESRLESAVKPALPESTRQVAGQVAGQVTAQVAAQVTAQVTAQVATLRNRGEVSNREIGIWADKNQSPPCLLAIRYSLLPSPGEIE